jgi:hypothetical protein
MNIMNRISSLLGRGLRAPYAPFYHRDERTTPKSTSPLNFFSGGFFGEFSGGAATRREG